MAVAEVAVEEDDDDARRASVGGGGWVFSADGDGAPRRRGSG
jgi:hypothetical protein